MSGGEEAWLRPLSTVELYAEMMHQQGTFITCYALALSAKEPLQELHVRKSLLHLLRKVPNLRLCIRPRNGKELWYQTMENETVDFQVCESSDFEKEYYDMTVHHYNSFDGPLWSTRLIPLLPETSCEFLDIEQKFPHQYQFLFGCHHAITDGTTTTKICNLFLEILNDVISEKPIDDLEQLGELASNERNEKIFAQVHMETAQNPEEIAKYHRLFNEEVEVLFLKAFPPPLNVKPQTRNLVRFLPKEENSMFLKKCKTEKVTFHTGFSSVINAAIVELLSDAGIKEELYKITNYHIVSLRRYWEGDVSKALGAYLGKITFITEIHNDFDNFWKQARDFHSAFHAALKDKGPYKTQIAMLMDLPSDVDLSKGVPPLPKMRLNYYGTTNMGNLDSVFVSDGDHVQLKALRRTTSTSPSNLCSHVLQSIRGKLFYGLDYEASLMSEATANMYADKIFDVMKRVTSM